MIGADDPGGDQGVLASPVFSSVTLVVILSVPPGVLTVFSSLTSVFCSQPTKANVETPTIKAEAMRRFMISVLRGMGVDDRFSTSPTSGVESSSVRGSNNATIVPAEETPIGLC